MHDSEIGVPSSGESQSLIHGRSYVDLLTKFGDCDCFGMWGLAKKLEIPLPCCKLNNEAKCMCSHVCIQKYYIQFLVMCIESIYIGQRVPLLCIGAS